MGGRLQGYLDALLVLFFAAALALPGLLRSDVIVAAEREWRAPTKVPDLGLRDTSAFPQRFDAWFADAHGLRERLVQLHHRLSWFAFGTSPVDAMVRGRESWVFSRRYNALSMDSGVEPFDEQELLDWKHALEARAEVCRELGAHFVFCLVPNKGRVYRDLWPESIEARGPSRLDQLRRALMDSEVDFLDLAPALEEARIGRSLDDLLFYPLGVHWTAAGAFVGQRVLLDHLAEVLPDVRSVGEDEVQQVPLRKLGDDWSERMYLDELVDGEVPGLELRDPIEAEIQPIKHGVKAHRWERDGTGSVVSFFADSFSGELFPFVRQGIPRLTFSRQYDLDLELIREQKPAVVVQFYGGRLLSMRPPDCMNAAQQHLYRTAYRRAPKGDRSWPTAQLHDALTLEGLGIVQGTEEGAILRVGEGEHRVLFRAEPTPDALFCVVLRVADPGFLALRATGTELEEDRLLARRNLKRGLNELYVPLDLLEPGERLSLRLGGMLKAMRIEEVGVRTPRESVAPRALPAVRNQRRD